MARIRAGIAAAKAEAANANINPDILQKAKQSLMFAEDLNAITNPDVFRKTSFELGLTVRFKAAGRSKFKYLFSG